MFGNLHRSTVKLFWYGATVFLSSAFLLVLEIVAGRLLAPYIGVSLYTWTSIIGVILAGLSLGNWVGGRIADRGAGEPAVGAVLISGAAACFGILSLLILIAGPLQSSELSLLSASFVYVIALFFLPAVLLGTISPILTTLALNLDARTGHVVGRMHALSALGSIAGTFATGYFLVQTFGTKNIIVGTSAGLVLLALPFLRQIRPRLPLALGLLLLLGALITGTQHVQGFVNPCDRESNYYCLRVVDERDGAGNLAARSLILDHMSHSTNVKHSPEALWVPYVHAMDEILHFYSPAAASLKYFFAGGGAYTHPRSLRYRYADAEITVSELDPTVTAIARSQLYFDPVDIRIIHGDARVALQSLIDERFDVIVTDVFHDLTVPYHLTTLEYLRVVKSRLTHNGLYLLNVVDIFPNARLVKAIAKTLEKQFRFVDVWLEHAPDLPARLTYVISASDRSGPPDTLRAISGEPRTWYRINDILYATGTRLSALPVLTDDYAPVDSLVAPLLTSKAGR